MGTWPEDHAPRVGIHGPIGSIVGNNAYSGAYDVIDAASRAGGEVAQALGVLRDYLATT